jgi:hypothetical protein
MKRRKFNIIKQNAAGSRQFLMLSKLPLFVKTIFYFKNPFIARFGTFENINNRTHCNDEYQNPFIIELIHSPVD